MPRKLTAAERKTRAQTKRKLKIRALRYDIGKERNRIISSKNDVAACNRWLKTQITRLRKIAAAKNKYELRLERQQRNLETLQEKLKCVIATKS